MKTSLMFKTEILLGRSLEKFLATEYIDNGLSLDQICIKLSKMINRKINKVLIMRWLKKFGIPTRRSEIGDYQRIIHKK
jgi:hypothetical protein